jgi:hypothetical protein
MKYIYYKEHNTWGMGREFMGIVGGRYWVRKKGTGWDGPILANRYQHPKNVGETEWEEYTGFDDPNFILDMI